MPQFSIVIPTCRRADTLVHALRCASEQDFDDFEILVHESGDDPATARAVEGFVDPRIRHIKTVRHVSMTENWELALRCCTGTYITFVGDDDGLFPGACSAAAAILKNNPSDLLSWRPACYYWPRYCMPEMRNRLVLDLPRERGVESLDSRSVLELVYQFRQNYSELPMIYNSFVSRMLVDRVIEKAGRYFIGTAPDVTSGIANAWLSENFLLSRTPLSCSGLSHSSSGHRMFVSGSDQLWNEAVADSIGTGSPVPMKDLNLFLAGEMLVAKQLLFPEGPPFLNYPNLLWSAVHALNYSPSRYDERLSEIRQLAARLAISIDEWIEAPLENGAVPAQGLQFRNDGILFDLDCSKLDLLNIYQVTRLLSALLPRPSFEKAARRDASAPWILPGCDTVLQFGRGGNGLAFLGLGWGEPEQWGVWSLGSSAEIVIPVQGNRHSPPELTVKGDLLIHSLRPSARGSISLNGGPAADFEASVEQPSVCPNLSLPSGAMLDGSLTLGFRIENSRSPAEDGVGLDPRRLGFALKEIEIRWPAH